MSYKISLGKEVFKFSCTHFTIFGPLNAERLHGHNYHVTFDLYFDQVSKNEGLAIDFNKIKPLIKEICEQLDEHILIPENSPHIGLDVKSEQIDLTFAKKKYSFPKQDVRILPLVNISSEELARYVCQNFLSKVNSEIGLTQIETTIEETKGQSVTYIKKLAQ